MHGLQSTKKKIINVKRIVNNYFNNGNNSMERNDNDEVDISEGNVLRCYNWCIQERTCFGFASPSGENKTNSSNNLDTGKFKHFISLFESHFTSLGK